MCLSPPCINEPGLTPTASIVKEIARAVDLNTLHALARTCRQFHANLSPFRHQLVRETLRCENEYIETVAEMLGGGTVLPNSVKSVLRLLSQGNGEPGRMTRGKVGKCARDMVGECRRCSKIVCRVCYASFSCKNHRLTLLRIAQSSLPPRPPLRVVFAGSAVLAVPHPSPATSPPRRVLRARKTTT